MHDQVNTPSKHLEIANIFHVFHTVLETQLGVWDKVKLKWELKNCVCQILFVLRWALMVTPLLLVVFLWRWEAKV